MIDTTKPLNQKAVELFTNHLPNWFSPIVIQAHIKSCDNNIEFSYANPRNLKDALALNLDWDIIDVKELSIQTEGNEIQVGSEALTAFFEQFVISPKPTASIEVATSNEKVATSNEKVESSELKLSPDAIEYFNRIAEIEKGKKAVVITDPWLIIGVGAAMTIGCSILGAFFFQLISQLFQ